MTLLLLYRSGYNVGQYICIEKAIADTKMIAGQTVRQFVTSGILATVDCYYSG